MGFGIISAMDGEPKTIGGLEVVRLLGRGGMSEVYEAVDPRLGSRHAVKLYAYPKQDDEVRRRFEAEGRLLARLSHPRVVKVTDLGEEGGRPYFVMDLVLGPDGRPTSLADVPDGSADEETIGRWYDDVREALQYVHANGVIHRDLKLQNIMVGPDNHAVLMDFGIFKAVDGNGGAAQAAATVNTLVSMRDGKRPLMGSLGYMAPELELGVAASRESDWYALGVIAYKLLTGTWCDSRTDVVSALGTYDPAWASILPKLLHLNPEGRECLSFAEEKSRLRELAEADAERRYLREKGRGHFARHVARYVAAAAIAASVGCLVLTHALVKAREGLASAARRLETPGFAEIFRTPDLAELPAMEDAVVDMSAFELAQIDAWVLVHRTFDDLAAGRVSFDEARATVSRIAKLLKEDNLPFGTWGDYTSQGDEDALKALFAVAVARMEKAEGPWRR